MFSLQTKGPEIHFLLIIYERANFEGGSNLPGLSRAGSRVSCRLVAIITCKKNHQVIRFNTSKSSQEIFSWGYLDIGGLVEAVHLVEQLKQDPLHLPVGPRLRVKPLCCDGVDLVDEDDRGRVLLGEAEDVSHHARAFAKVLLHKLASHNPEK